MGRNMLVIGERNINGNFGSVKLAGELTVKESTVKSLYGAGEVNIIKSELGKIYIAGELNADSITFDSIKVAGEISMKGVCQGKLLVAYGDLSSEYLECQILKNGKFKSSSSNSGYCKWHGTIKATTFENYLEAGLDFDYEFQNIISYEMLSCQSEIMCEHFYGLSPINAPAINAEYIFIQNHESTYIELLAGSKVIISSSFNPDKLYKSIPKSKALKVKPENKVMTNIRNIEADYVQIEYTASDLVSGHDVIVGDLCMIERVEYRNSVKISDKAIVNELVQG